MSRLSIVSRVTDSVASASKRERLTAAAQRVFHEQGVEKTTLADIARVADVPLGNVYYYFKTKDQLVQATIDSHAEYLGNLTDELDRLDSPGDRLKGLIDFWVSGRDLAARYGCPFGTLTVELDKREDGLDQAAGEVMRKLIDWCAAQFSSLGCDDVPDLAITLVGAYQGMAVLANALRDPSIMEREGHRLGEWIDSLG
jgi:TetR/AcrR family transcriptional regulator, transcriptional repressor for nem operon